MIRVHIPRNNQNPYSCDTAVDYSDATAWHTDSEDGLKVWAEDDKQIAQGWIGDMDMRLEALNDY